MSATTLVAALTVQRALAHWVQRGEPIPSPGPLDGVFGPQTHRSFIGFTTQLQREGGEYAAVDIVAQGVGDPPPRTVRINLNSDTPSLDPALLSQLVVALETESRTYRPPASPRGSAEPSSPSTPSSGGAVVSRASGGGGMSFGVGLAIGLVVVAGGGYLLYRYA